MAGNSNNKSVYPYYSNGRPYIKVLDFSAVQVASGTVTVGDVVYTIGTDVFTKDPAGGLAFSVAEAINANSANFGQNHLFNVPNTFAYAKVAGAQVVLFGLVPGEDFEVDTDIASATSQTWSAGAASGESGGSSTLTATNAFTDTYLAMVEIPGTKHFVVRNLSGHDVQVRTVDATAGITISDGFADTFLGAVENYEIRSADETASGTVEIKATI